MEATSKWNAALRIQGRDSRIAEQSKELIALQAENAKLREALEVAACVMIESARGRVSSEDMLDAGYQARAALSGSR